MENSTLLDDLHNLPFVTYESRHDLPDAAAVYIVARDADILYIGSAVNLRKRWLSHHRARLIEHESNIVIRWQTVSLDSLRITETAYVKALRPTWNSRYVKPKRPVNRLGELLRCYRKWDRLSIGRLALEVGISEGALSRMEQGRNVEGVAFRRVLIWLLRPDTQNGKPKGAK